MTCRELTLSLALPAASCCQRRLARQLPAMADAKKGQKGYSSVYDDENQALAPMSVGAEPAVKGGHSGFCVAGATTLDFTSR